MWLCIYPYVHVTFYTGNLITVCKVENVTLYVTI